jgi:hypothetical protein
VTGLPFLAPNAIASSAPTNSIPGAPALALWWVASDTLVFGTNIAVTNWTERVNGVQSKQGDASRQPTNSLLGVGFGGAQDLTNVSTLTSHSNTFFVIYEATATAPIANVLGGGGYGFSLASLEWYESGTPLTKLSSAVSLNQVKDFVWNGTNTFYTNNVVSATGISLPGIGFTNIGSAMPSTPNSFWKGYILEIAVWTNTVLSAVNISNIHYYATNTYGFSP